MHLSDVISTTENCRYCLMCRHLCPVGRVTQRETLTPHGWGLTIASVRRGLTSWNAETVAVLYSCADCGNCRAHCVTDQPLPDAIVAARAEVVNLQLAPPQVYDLSARLERWGNIYVDRPPRVVEERAEVALFVGDEAPYLWPSTLEAALRLLAAAGVRPVLVGVGRNNGYLASSLGLPAVAAALARANLRDIANSGARKLLVLTPGDYYAFTQLYPERLDIVWPEEIQVQELVTYLVEQQDRGRIALRPGDNALCYAYLDPTHAVRVPTRFDAPRQLLSAIMPAGGIELFWRRERSMPCGNTALQFLQPELAQQLTCARLEDARNVGAELVLTDDPGCLSHLHQYAPAYGLQVQGLYEVLAGHLAE